MKSVIGAFEMWLRNDNDDDVLGLQFQKEKKTTSEAVMTLGRRIV